MKGGATLETGATQSERTEDGYVVRGLGQSPGRVFIGRQAYRLIIGRRMCPGERLVIPTGPGAEGISVSPDGREVWVANRQEESISIIDTELLQKVASVDSRPFAGRVEIGPNGRAVAPNGGGGGQPVRQYLRLFDVESRTMIAEVPLRDGTPGTGNFGVLIHDGFAFVSEPGQGTIRLFDLDALGESEPQVLVSAHESPDGLAWSPVRVAVMR